jgi:hypothetical protein
MSRGVAVSGKDMDRQAITERHGVSGAVMSSFHCWGLVCAWALLAASPVGAADTDRPRAASPPAAVSATAAPSRPIANCPHCRKLGLVGATPAASLREPEWGSDELALVPLPRDAALTPAPATAAAAPAAKKDVAVAPASQRPTRDAEVRQAQVPAVPEVPRPRMVITPLPAPGSSSAQVSNTRVPILPILDPPPETDPDTDKASTRSSAPIPVPAPDSAATAAPEAPSPPDPSMPLAVNPVETSPPMASALPGSPPPLAPPGSDGHGSGSGSGTEAMPTARPTTQPSALALDAATNAQATAPHTAPTVPPAAEVGGPDPFTGAVAPAEIFQPNAYAGPGPARPWNGYTLLPVMLGDQPPPSLRMPVGPPVPRPPVPGRPPLAPSPFARGGHRSTAVIPWARGFKIADNQSPMPQDRVFYTFDYFNNLNDDVNKRLGSSVSSMQAYRQLLGIEKTFWGGNASLGLRMPIDTLWTRSSNSALRNGGTAVGNLSFFSKFVLWANPNTGNLLSGGLAITVPNGPSSFAGTPATAGFRDVQFQPFLGYIVRRGDLYLQGFTAIDVPTDPNDVTMWYNDVALGYFVYRNDAPTALLSAIVPTFEVHLSDPLNHRGAFRFNDPAGTPDILDLTFGSSFILRKRLVASFGVAFPVTDPHPFDVEALALLNFYFGRGGMATPILMPPPATGR